MDHAERRRARARAAADRASAMPRSPARDDAIPKLEGREASGASPTRRNVQVCAGDRGRLTRGFVGRRLAGKVLRQRRPSLGSRSSCTPATAAVEVGRRGQRGGAGRLVRLTAEVKRARERRVKWQVTYRASAAFWRAPVRRGARSASGRRAWRASSGADDGLEPRRAVNARRGGDVPAGRSPCRTRALDRRALPPAAGEEQRKQAFCKGVAGRQQTARLTTRPAKDRSRAQSEGRPARRLHRRETVVVSDGKATWAA